MRKFQFQVLHRDKKTKARVGEIHTPHGVIKTPAFVAVGTQATVKSLTPEELNTLGVQLFFVNTYHVYLKPGLEVIKKFGGLHKFMHWDKPLITDSGGFQVFSLGRKKRVVAEVANAEIDSGGVYRGSPFAAHPSSNTLPVTPSDHTLRDGARKPACRRGRDSPRHAASDIIARGVTRRAAAEDFLAKITDDGVEFRSHWDGSRHFFTPEKSIEIQHTLAADITIAFDECTAYPTTHTYAHKAMERTHRWARQSLEYHRQLSLRGAQATRQSHVKGKQEIASPSERSRNDKHQALYGVVQGSVFEDLRKVSARVISSLGFDGIAIGGVSVGESKKEMVDVLDWTVPLLPDEAPRHLLGVGEIDDIFALIARGIDTFDCVQPTRLGRMGHVFNAKCQMLNAKWELDITKKIYAEDTKPIDPECQCYTCAHFSRAYLHHLFRVRELLAYRLATIHNIHFVNTLIDQIRQAIVDGSFLELARRWI